jgi:gluconokinase
LLVTSESPISEPVDRTAIIVMGVSGCGKSTVAEGLAARLGWPFSDGDSFHPAANVAKMEAGTPLTDVDRMPWLHSIRDWISEADGDVVVTCSALRRLYRDVLREAIARVRFVSLVGSRELLVERMGARTGHFMPLKLLDSQLATLEPLQPDEDGAEVSIDATPEAIVDAALAALDLRMS